MSTDKPQRIFGLDLLRSAAIIIVTISHSNSLMAAYYPDFFSIPLPDGVDLFFVLSGYLIGSILINSIEEAKGFSFSMLSIFLQRRWLRTLPNYFLFLIINVVLIQLGLISGVINKYFVTYLVFFQNFYKPYDFMFWESWSLSVEEWFYLSFPFILLILLKIKPNNFKIKNAVLFAILLFLVFPFVYRMLSSHLAINESLRDLYIRKLVLTRLDCIAFGLFGAYFKYYYSELWSKSKAVLFVLGIILLCLLCSNFPIFHAAYFSNVLYFSFIGLAVLFLLPFLESLKKEKIPYKPFGFTSKISYSMYLVQIPLFQIFSNSILVESKTGAACRYVVYWLSLILLSALVYQYYEKFFLKLRKGGLSGVQKAL